MEEKSYYEILGGKPIRRRPYSITLTVILATKRLRRSSRRLQRPIACFLILTSASVTTSLAKLV